MSDSRRQKFHLSQALWAGPTELNLKTLEDFEPPDEGEFSKQVIFTIEDLLALKTDRICFTVDGDAFEANLESMRMHKRSMSTYSISESVCNESDPLASYLDGELLDDQDQSSMNRHKSFMTSSESRGPQLSFAASNPSQQHRLDIAFLFALPVTILRNLPGQQREFLELDRINWQAELKQIKQLISEKGPRVSIFSMVATAQNLVDTLNKAPRILHISCHGVETKNHKNSDSRIKQARNQAFSQPAVSEMEGLKDFSLLLETPDGDAHLLSALELKRELGKFTEKLDLIILQACLSEPLGKVF